MKWSARQPNVDVAEAMEQLSRRHRKLVGYDPCFTSPASHVERLLHRLIHCRDARLPALVDKIEVKNHVRRLLGEEWITPTLWHGEELAPSCELEPHVPFVLKASNASNRNAFVLSKEEMWWRRLHRQTQSWLRTPYGVDTYEWFYSMIRPRLLLEPFLNSAFARPLDYRLYVFGGIVHLIEVSVDRAEIYKWTYYSPEWTRWAGAENYRTTEREIAKPACLDDMIAGAQLLAADHPFVRVDLYEIQGRPRFSELTFFPAAGMDFFMSRSDNFALGRFWPSLDAESGTVPTG